MSSENLPARRPEVALAKPVRDSNTLKALLEQIKPELEASCSKYLTPDKLTSFVLTAFRKSKQVQKLMMCTGMSIAKSIMDCAELALVPTTALGQCFFVPYGNDCTLQIGFRGFIELAERSGQTTHISPRIVHEGDAFDFQYGTSPFVKHKPTGEAGRTPTHAYAIAYLRAGGPPPFVVMTKAEIDAHRDKYSKAYQYAVKDKRNDNPWMTAYEAMARKTVVRQLCKYLSLSPQLVQATVIDEYNEAGVTDRGPIPLTAGRHPLRPFTFPTGAGQDHQPESEDRPSPEPASPARPASEPEVNDSIGASGGGEEISDEEAARAYGEYPDR